MFGCARRGASGALIPKSALCGAEFPPEGLKLKSQGVILTGRRATDGHELRQVRKEAAISDAVCVVDRFRSCMWPVDFGTRFNGGCTTEPSKTYLYRRCPHLLNTFYYSKLKPWSSGTVEDGCKSKPLAEAVSGFNSCISYS